MIVRILSHDFTLEEVGLKDLTSNDPDNIALENFNVFEKYIKVAREIPVSMRKYSILHAIWEILLSITGQFYDSHEGFTGFSHLLFATLVDNKLGWLLTEDDKDYPLGKKNGTGKKGRRQDSKDRNSRGRKGREEEER